jgi:hypothetical protein
MRFKIGDRVKLKPRESGQHRDLAGHEGIIEGIEESQLHTHLGGIPQYEVRVIGSSPEKLVSLAESEVERLSRRQAS